MKYLGFLCCVAALALIASSRPVAAHHSFAAEFDASKTIELTGKVTKIEWTNPHAFIYIDAKDPRNNQTGNWAAELNSPNSLMRLGWTRDSLKVDEEIKVQGTLARNGSNLMNARTITLTKTNQRLFAGSSDGSPTR
jgi:hypothetical protein